MNWGSGVSCMTGPWGLWHVRLGSCLTSGISRKDAGRHSSAAFQAPNPTPRPGAPRRSPHQAPSAPGPRRGFRNIHFCLSFRTDSGIGLCKAAPTRCRVVCSSTLGCGLGFHPSPGPCPQDCVPEHGCLSPLQVPQRLCGVWYGWSQVGLAPLPTCRLSQGPAKLGQHR